jgi:hypothetical protein
VEVRSSGRVDGCPGARLGAGLGVSGGVALEVGREGGTGAGERKGEVNTEGKGQTEGSAILKLQVAALNSVQAPTRHAHDDLVRPVHTLHSHS